MTTGAEAVERVEATCCSVPLDEPESDGTLTWDSTDVMVVQAHGGGATGLGLTYGPAACATVVRDQLADVVTGTDPMDVAGTWSAMVRAIRNAGRPGVVSMALSAVDLALWDLKARLLEVDLATLLGRVRDEVPVYGSGGFCSLTDQQLAEQLGGWVHDQDIPRVKMKVGNSWGATPTRDLERMALARDVIGPSAELYVDANGGYTRKQAIRVAHRFAELGVIWFEEPVSSDDLDGLHEVRSQVLADVAAGEYGYDLAYFGHLLAADAVDVVQADVTRCGGITEWLRIAAAAAAAGLQISGHCAPSMHAAVAAAVPNLRHLEHFADHARAEALLLDGVLDPAGGVLRPDPARTGNGLTLAERAGAYEVGG